LEQRQVTPLGDEKPIALNVRVIAATNASYQLLSDETRFRQDLLYRLNTIELQLPPLRERREDIPLLVDYYLSHYAQKYQRHKPAIAAQALKALCAYDWPGNVRSLRHALERAIILNGEQTLQTEDFALQPLSPSANESSENSTQLNLEELERNAVTRALKQFSGNISQAAKALGITRTALYRRMEKYDL
jgi:DNA-binding NtrC family response regulator